uniref:NYN domain-containing protein n=1 Tax=Brassica oleracea var. oleracea TaxID=109376 RepID=A0A0D3BLC1_BRAOL
MEMAEAKFEEAATWVCWDIENCPIPNGCKAEEISQKISSALRSSSLHIFDKLLDWAYNPDTSNLMFISRDESFSSYLSEWQMDRNKNVLLAHPPNASDSFVASAKTTWLWNSLCRNLI